MFAFFDTETTGLPDWKAPADAPGQPRIASVAIILCADDYRVVEAADGAEAWAMVQTHKPALVLLDVQMPGQSGLEVLRLIKADPSLAATRVILLTAKAQETDIESGLIAGADFYLTKPFSPLDLLTRVEEALQL